MAPHPTATVSAQPSSPGRSWRQPLCLLAAVAMLALAGGCAQQSAGAGPWLDLPAEQPDRAEPGELFHRLATQASPVTQDQAYHAILVWLDGSDASANFGQRIQALEQRKLLSPSWSHHPLKPISRGRLASIVCRKLELKTSVALFLFGPQERLARRELVFQNIMGGQGGDNDTVAGPEFVTVLKRADERNDPDRDGVSPGQLQTIQ